MFVSLYVSQLATSDPHVSLCFSKLAKFDPHASLYVSKLVTVDPHALLICHRLCLAHICLATIREHVLLNVFLVPMIKQFSDKVVSSNHYNKVNTIILRRVLFFWLCNFLLCRKCHGFTFWHSIYLYLLNFNNYVYTHQLIHDVY